MVLLISLICFVDNSALVAFIPRDEGNILTANYVSRQNTRDLDQRGVNNLKWFHSSNRRAVQNAVKTILNLLINRELSGF